MVLFGGHYKITINYFNFSSFRKRKTSLPISKKIKVDTADVHPLDIGNFIGVELDDDITFNVAKNHWCPPSTFDFPYGDFSSANSKKPNRRRFCFQCFSRWTWLCYSMLYDVCAVLCLKGSWA